LVRFFRTKTGLNRFGSVFQFGSILAWFFFVWLGLFPVFSVWVWFGFFSFRLIKPKPNRIGWFFQNFNRFNLFFSQFGFFDYLFFYFLGLIDFSVFLLTLDIGTLSFIVFFRYLFENENDEVTR